VLCFAVLNMIDALADLLDESIAGKLPQRADSRRAPKRGPSEATRNPF
jgi:hypothetical protein